MTDELEQRIIDIVQEALRDKSDDQTVLIAADDSMETVAAWDSLTFMSVFLAINEAFSINPDFDEAIHYTSVKGICDYIKGLAA